MDAPEPITYDQYLATLPDERRELIHRVWQVVLAEWAARRKLDTRERFRDATVSEDRAGGQSPAAPVAGSGSRSRS